MKAPLLAIVALAVVACAATPETRWGQLQTIHNDLSAEIRAGYEPCLDHSEDHPRCIFDLDDFVRLDGHLDTVERHLDKYRETKDVGWLDAAQLVIDTVNVEITAMGI